MDLSNESLSASPTSEVRNAGAGGGTVESFSSAKSANMLVFGRYILQRVLGRGGMGVVWQARDTKLDRPVALKFIPDLVSADPVSVRELKDETKRGLDLAHPHIVRIYDFVDDADNAAIVMEFVDGKSLAELRLYQAQKVFNVEQISPWIVQVCEALDYAHFQRRLIHRDLKPANILLEADHIKITDFGIARQVTDTVTRLSMANATASGTLLYMSPQQTMGDRPRPTDDVYSLGACIFELLTGKPPFYTGDVTVQILHKKAHRLAARLQELEIATPWNIPPEWEEAVASCLDKNPARRPQSAGELAARLGLGSASVTGRSRSGATAPATVSSSLMAQTSPDMESLGGEETLRSAPIPGSPVPATTKAATPSSGVRATAFRLHWVSLLMGVATVALVAGLVWWTGLQHAPGTLLLYSDPDQVHFEVTPADGGSAAKVSGETPRTLQLPAGRYHLTVTHQGESKSADVEVKSRVELAKSFRFVQETLAKSDGKQLAPPLLRLNPPSMLLKAPPLLAAIDAPVDEIAPSDPSSVPAPLVAASEFKPVTLPPSTELHDNSPTIAAADATRLDTTKPEEPKIADAPPAAEEDTPPENPATPAEGYWKLNDLFSSSDYHGYSENGRHYVLFRVQKALKDKELYEYALDGREGKGTHRAIESYQKASHLTPTGQLDTATLASLSLTGLPDKDEWTAPVHHTASKVAAPQPNWWVRNVQNPLKHVFQNQK